MNPETIDQLADAIAGLFGPSNDEMDAKTRRIAELVSGLVHEILEKERQRIIGDAATLEVGELDMGDEMRRIAREEIASLSGLVLSRTQNRGGMAMRTELAAIFGEALRDFSQTEDEPGPAEPDTTPAAA